MNDSLANTRTRPRTNCAEEAAGESSRRIEYDRRRVFATVLVSGFATLATWGGLIVALAHPGAAQVGRDLPPELRGYGLQQFTVVPWWAVLALVPAALVATFQFLACLFRLQDGDPAFVLSPRGMLFRPSVFGERVRVPWTAIRRVKARRFKNHRSIVLYIDEIDRYAPRGGLLGTLRRLRDAAAGGGSVRVRTPMSQNAWKQLAALLQEHVARYGREPATRDAGARGGDAPPAPR